MGLAILSTFSPEDISGIIISQDKKLLTSVSGVGPRLAERIITELKNKVASLATDDLSINNNSKTSNNSTALPKDNNIKGDAISALVALGYGRMEAFRAVEVNINKTDSIDELIKLSLKELG